MCKKNNDPDQPLTEPEQVKMDKIKALDSKENAVTSDLRKKER